MKRRTSARIGLVIAVLVAAIVALLLKGRLSVDTDARTNTGDGKASTAITDATFEPRASSPVKPKQPALTPEAVARAESEQRCTRDRVEQYREVRDDIDPTTSPEQAVTHALLTQALAPVHDTTPEVQREALEALQRWPDNLELAWLAYSSCLEPMGCDRNAALVRLQQADGDNLFAWMPSVNQAVLDKAPEPFARAVHRAANAPIYDARQGFVHLRLWSALSSLPVPSTCTYFGNAEQLAAAQVSASNDVVAMPGIAGLLGCGQPNLARTEQARNDCRRLLERFSEGESLLEQQFALAMLIEIGEHKSAALAALRERYRRAHWLHTFDPGGIDGFAWRQWADGEVSVLIDHARQTGRWPPPNGWLPNDPRARLLILGN